MTDFNFTRSVPAGWQPIASAPTDRAIVILDWWSYRVDPKKKLYPERNVAHWSNESQEWRDDHGEPLTDAAPSHWHELEPVPTAPETALSENHIQTSDTLADDGQPDEAQEWRDYDSDC